QGAKSKDPLLLAPKRPDELDGIDALIGPSASQDDRGIGEAKLPGQLPVVCDQTLRRAWVASLAHQDRGTRELPWPGPDITIHQPSMDHPELPSARRTNECIHGNGVQLHSCRIKQEMQPGRGENTKSFSVGEISPEWPAQ